MIEIKNITIREKITDRVLVEKFSFVLEKGDKSVLIGEEGNGKSTLLKLIYDSNLIADYCNYSGTVQSKGLVCYLPQDLSVYAETAIGGLLPKELDYALLSRLNLDKELITGNRKLKTYSGGERVKLLLFALLSKKPDFLLLDEPTNDIDENALLFLEGFLSKPELGVLYISHDETLIERTANIVIHLEQLRKKSLPRHTVEYMNYSEYVQKRRLAFQKQEQVAKMQEDALEQKQQRFQQIYNKVEFQQNAISRGDPHGGRLLKKKMKSLKSQQKRLQNEEQNLTEYPDKEDSINIKFINLPVLPPKKVVLELKDEPLYIGAKMLSKSVSLNLTAKEKIVITGENGSGKSTLLKLIFEKMAEKVSFRVFYLPQNYAERLDYAMSPFEYLNANYDKQKRTQCMTLLGSLKFLSTEMQTKIGNLSGGQLVKLLLAEMIIGEYDVLLLDEPTRNLSPLSQPEVRKLFQSFSGAIISVSHDRKWIEEVAETNYKLTENGFLRQ